MLKLLSLFLLVLSASVASASSVVLTSSFGVDGTFDETLSVNGSGAYFYELDVRDKDFLAQFTLLDAGHDLRSARYSLFEDADLLLGQSELGGLLRFAEVAGSTHGSSIPVFRYLLQEGRKYVLKVELESGGAVTQTRVSAVPLPASFWLFGSALLGFVTFSNRRKV